MRRECRERFPRHCGLAIPPCITARASRTCRYAWRELAVSFEVGGKTFTVFRMRNPQFYVTGKGPVYRWTYNVHIRLWIVIADPCSNYNNSLVKPPLSLGLTRVITSYQRQVRSYPDNKVHEANMGPIWGRQNPGGPMLAPWTLLSGNHDLFSEKLDYNKRRKSLVSSSAP